MPTVPPTRAPRPQPDSSGRTRVRGAASFLLAVALALVPAVVAAQAAGPRIESSSYDAAAQTLTIQAAGIADPSSVLVTVDGTPYTPSIEVASAAGGGGTLMIAIEASSSTAFTFLGPTSLLEDQKAAAAQLVKNLPADVAVGLVVFGDKATLTHAPTTDHAAVVASIEAIAAGTNSILFDGVALAASTLQGATAPRELAVFTYGWHFGVSSSSAADARAAVAASGATVHSFAMGLDYDFNFLGGIANDSGGALHRSAAPADLAAVQAGLGGAPSTLVLTVPVELGPGEHTVEVTSAEGAAATAVTVEDVLTAAATSDGTDGTLQVRLAGTPEGAVATISLAGRELASGPADAPFSIDTWDLQPGAATLTVEVSVEGAPASVTTLEVTVPTLEPQLTIEPAGSEGEFVAAARVQRGTEATFSVLVDGDEAYSGAPDSVTVDAPAGASIEARLETSEGSALAEQTFEVPGAPAATPAAEASGGLPWASIATIGALAALAVLAIRVLPKLLARARGRLAARASRPRRRRSPAMLSARVLGESDRDDLALHYQPLFDVTGQRVKGAEALLRWEDPERGVSAARHFLTRAAALEMLPGATEWVMRTACTFARQRQMEGLTDFHITVNVTVGQVTSEGFVEAIENALRVSGLAARFLEIELTEMSVLGKRSALAPVLERVAELGVGVSVDDFWAPGGSAEAVELPGVVAVKVDLWSNTGSAAAREQIAAAVTVAKERQLATVAKRVETVHEMSFFRTLGCDAVQGNAYGAPMPEAEFIRRIGQIDEAARLAG
ncbi:MAG: EAL domain-containing protein [Dehalococcoidia bacterium]